MNHTIARPLPHAGVLFWFFSVLLAWGVGAPGLARAQAASEVSLEVMVVHATNDHSRVDARLSKLMPHVRHLNYSGYSVLETNQERLGPKQAANVGLVGGRRLRVRVLEVNDRKVRLRVRMFKGSDTTLDTTVNVPRNRSFIVAGPRHDGGVLLIPLTARY